MLCVGGVQEVVELIEQHEAQAAFAFQGIERVGLQVGVFRGQASSGQVVGELSHIAAFSYTFRFAAMLSCRGEKACRWHIVGTILDEDYLAVLLRVLRYLGQRLVDV